MIFSLMQKISEFPEGFHLLELYCNLVLKIILLQVPEMQSRTTLHIV